MGGGGNSIFSYICRLRSFFGGSKFIIQYFWGFQENEDFVDFLGVITKFDYIRSHF